MPIHTTLIRQSIKDVSYREAELDKPPSHIREMMRASGRTRSITSGFVGEHPFIEIPIERQFTADASGASTHQCRVAPLPAIHRQDMHLRGPREDDLAGITLNDIFERDDNLPGSSTSQSIGIADRSAAPLLSMLADIKVRSVRAVC